MRKRLREQRRVREARLLDLGALVYELHRQGKRAPELLQEKAAELSLIDDEVRQLEARLEGPEWVFAHTEGEFVDLDDEDDDREDDEPEDDLDAHEDDDLDADEDEPAADRPDHVEQPTAEADALDADPLAPQQAEERA